MKKSGAVCAAIFGIGLVTWLFVGEGSSPSAETQGNTIAEVKLGSIQSIVTAQGQKITLMLARKSQVR